MGEKMKVVSDVISSADTAIKTGKDIYELFGNALGEAIVDVLKEGAKNELVPKGILITIEKIVEKFGASIIGNQVIGQLITQTIGTKDCTNLHDILSGRIPRLKLMGKRVGNAVINRRDPNNFEETLSQFIGDMGGFILAGKAVEKLIDQQALGGQILSLAVGLLSIEITRQMGQNSAIRVTPYVTPYLKNDVLIPENQAESIAQKSGKAATVLVCAYGISLTSFASVIPPLLAGTAGYKMLGPLIGNAAVKATRDTGKLYSYCCSVATMLKNSFEKLYIEKSQKTQNKDKYSKNLIFKDEEEAILHLLGPGHGKPNISKRG